MSGDSNRKTATNNSTESHRNKRSDGPDTSRLSGDSSDALSKAQGRTDGPDTSGTSGGPPGGLTVTGHAVARQGYQTLISNPELTIRYEATKPAWKGTGGFSPDAKSILEDRGIHVAREVNNIPAGSIRETPGVKAQSVTTHNGRLAEKAIADRYRQTPGARVDLQYRYDADLKPVTEARRDLLGDRKVDVRVELDHPTDARLNAVIEVESKATTRITPSKLNTVQFDHDVARLSRNGALRTAGQQLEVVGKYARPVGFALDAVNVASAYRSDGNSIGKNTGEAVSGIVGGGAGGWAGVSAGAAIGTAIMPGGGTVVGGLIGGAVGAWGGDKVGRGVFGTVAGWFD